jgi:glycosyltransferase involved in cell wall biosynthesis
LRFYELGSALMVGISLLTLVPRVSGGSETYARELVRALARVGRLRYHVYAPTIAPDAADGLPATVVTSYRAATSTTGRLRAMAVATAFPAKLRREVRGAEPSALHFPLTITIPRGTGLPVATSILDLQHEFFPQFFPRAERLYRRVAYRAAARNSRLVIAISEHVRESIVERLGIQPDRVRVAYLGIDLERLRPGEGQREPIILYPANGWPHKNHARLLDAFRLIRDERPELRLVLTGEGLERLPKADGVENRGHVPRDELVGLYQRAQALVFPSLYEGFGLPPLEAMACGCPVAVSRAGALPEVCAEAARYFDPEDPEDIATAALALLANPRELVERGLERARRFTWDACAQRHDELYEELSGA